MLIDKSHRISGTHTVERIIRFRRPAFLLRSIDDFRSVVRGACGLSGGRFCHLIPMEDGQLADTWSSYIQRLCPDTVYVPTTLVDLKPRLQKLITGLVLEVDYGGPVTWGGSPALHSLLTDRNPDGSPKACGPCWLVDIELSSEAPPVSELQWVARFGLIPEISTRRPPFLGVHQQLRELVHTVPPDSGQELIEWLFGIPNPDQSVPSPPYLTYGGAINSAIALNHTGIRSSGQSYPPDHRDSPWSLANHLVVVGNGDSLQDACLFWNLRANRPSGPLPAWVTPEQAELPEVRSAIAHAASLTPTGPGPSTGGVDGLHLLSATMDTREMARVVFEKQAVGWAPTDWIHFIDRRHRLFFGRSKEAIVFTDGHASFFIKEDAFPCPWPTQITVDIEIESFRPPPTGTRLSGINGPQIGRFGEALFPLNCWGSDASAEEASLGYPRTFGIIQNACEETGLRPTFDRKAALAHGINRMLADDFRAHMILRNHDVIGLLQIMIDSEKDTGETERRLGPSGTSFGEFHNKLNDHGLASALLSWLLRKSLVFRGLELDCTDCGTRAWYSLNEVGNLFRCIGCQAQQSFDRMPHDASWRYRVNQLLASALDQGVLQEVLAAYAIDIPRLSGSRAHVFPNVILANTNTGDHVAEVDLLGFANGVWLAAECKAWGDVTQSELESLRSILDSLGGGWLLLVRASSASEACDALADAVSIWDHDPIRGQPVDSDQLRQYLQPN